MTSVKFQPLFLAAVIVTTMIILVLAFAAIDASAALKPCYPKCPW